MRRLALLILFLPALFHLQAQDATLIASQLQELKQATHDSDRIYLLNQLCFNYSNVNADSGILLGEQAYELAVKAKNDRGIADSYNNRGWCYYRKSEYRKAEEFLLKAINEFEKLKNPKFLSVSHSNLGWVHFSQSHFPEAIKYFLLSMEEAEAANDDEGVAIILYSIGVVYNRQNNTDEARKYFFQALEMEEKLNRPLKKATSLSGIGNSYTKDGNFDKALEYLQQALVIYTESNDQYQVGFINENIGDSYNGMKDYDKALRHFFIAKEKYIEAGFKEDIAYINMRIGTTYKAAGKTVAAIAVLQEGLAVAKEIGADDEQEGFHLHLSEAYADLGDYSNAYSHYKQSMRIRDTLFTREKEDELLRLQTEFETERTEKENQLLKAENDANEARLQRNRTLLIAAGISIVLLALLLYVVYRNRQTQVRHVKELEKLNAQLNEQKDEISRMNTLLELKALRAQMNPHFIFNCMSSIQECMLTGRLEDANTYLSKLSKLLRMVLEHSDDESVTLEKELEMLHLYLELESVRLKDGFEYEIKVDKDIFPEEITVPTLILQPFAENAIWHGLLNKQDNRKLKISIHSRDEELTCVIEDNGVGREQAAILKPLRKKHESKGIQLIDRRLRILRAKSKHDETGIFVFDLYNDMHQPAGTKVEINLPLVAS